MAFAAARMIKDRKDQENRKRSTDEMQNSMYKKMVIENQNFSGGWST